MVYLTCIVIGLCGGGEIIDGLKWQPAAPSPAVTSDLTSMVPPQFRHCLQEKKLAPLRFFFVSEGMLTIGIELCIRGATYFQLGLVPDSRYTM